MLSTTPPPEAVFYQSSGANYYLRMSERVFPPLNKPMCGIQQPILSEVNRAARPRQQKRSPRPTEPR